jgi:GNAT superfamily N-acetyltransferase
VYLTAFEQVRSDPRSRLIVAEADGQVAGTLQLSLLPGLSRHGMLRAQIEGVRVAAPHRGQGLGRTMIEWAIGQAREHGCGLVQLTSDKQRHDAVRFTSRSASPPRTKDSSSRSSLACARKSSALARRNAQKVTD